MFEGPNIFRWTEARCALWVRLAEVWARGEVDGWRGSAGAKRGDGWQNAPKGSQGGRVWKGFGPHSSRINSDHEFGVWKHTPRPFFTWTCWAFDRWPSTSLTGFAADTEFDLIQQNLEVWECTTANTQSFFLQNTLNKVRNQCLQNGCRLIKRTRLGLKRISPMPTGCAMCPGRTMSFALIGNPVSRFQGSLHSWRGNNQKGPSFHF